MLVHVIVECSRKCSLRQEASYFQAAVSRVPWGRLVRALGLKHARGLTRDRGLVRARKPPADVCEMLLALRCFPALSVDGATIREA